MVAKLKVPLALAVASLAVAYLVVTGVSRNDMYMSTLDDWDPDRARRESVRLAGFVADGSVQQEPDRLVTHFALRNEAASQSIPVRFDGVTPDLFRDGAQVVATGTLSDDGTFVATDLMTKCPSKYEGAEAHPEGVGPSAAASQATPAVAAR